MADAFENVWASDDAALIEVPSAAQIELGFVCGKASPGLFNWLFQTLMSRINALNIGDMASKFRQINTVDGITGGGDLQSDLTLRLDITTLEVGTEIAAEDQVAIYDASVNGHRRITRENFLAGIGGGGSTITDGANIGNGTGNVYSGLSGNVLQFRTIRAGAGVTVTTAGNVVDVGIANMGAQLTF